MAGAHGPRAPSLAECGGQPRTRPKKPETVPSGNGSLGNGLWGRWIVGDSVVKLVTALAVILLLSAFLYQCARQAPLDRDTPAQDSPQSPDGR